MLAQAPMTTVLPAEDLQRARHFYEQILGLQLADEIHGGLVFNAGAGTRLYVFPFGRSDVDYAKALFHVPDVPEVVRALRAKGVVFKDYDMPNLKTVEGISEMGGGRQAAWFNDPEGNLLGLVTIIP